MKKILAKLLAAALVVVMVLTLVACGAKPELDLEDAAENLEDNGYTVHYTDEDLDVPYAKRLSAYDDDNTLVIIEFQDTKSAKLYYESIKMEYDCEIDELKLELEGLELEKELYEHIIEEYDRDLSNDEIDDYEEEIDDIEDDIKEIEKEIEKMKEDYSFGRSGKIVWAGTVDAIEDSKR